MIEARGLTKRYGAKTAVDNLSFQVRPGIVTGFLGPNGSGKSTTMRMILGLDSPSSGSVTVGGQPFKQLPNPARTLGALLDAKSMHPGRSARANLLSLARLAGLPSRRVDEVLAQVGLQEVSGRRAGGFSLGMGQRLGIAAALLGDPQVLMLDEPVNGLDPEGVLWVRQLIRSWAAEGRTVFVSSHLMSEMALTADHLVIIGQGKLLADMTLQGFIQQYSSGYVGVRTPPEDSARLVGVLSAAGGNAQPNPDGSLKVTGLEANRISELAHAQGIRLLELSPQQASLEEAYMRMTQHAVEYRASAPGAAPQAAGPGATGYPGMQPGMQQGVQPGMQTPPPMGSQPFPGAPGPQGAPAGYGPTPGAYGPPPGQQPGQLPVQQPGQQFGQPVQPVQAPVPQAAPPGYGFPPAAGVPGQPQQQVNPYATKSEG